MDLELAAPVRYVDERRAPVAAPARHAARDAVRLIRLLAGLHRVMSRVDLRDRRHALELMRKRLDPLLTQALQLGPAIVDRWGVVHAAGGY